MAEGDPIVTRTETWRIDLTAPVPARYFASLIDSLPGDAMVELDGPVLATLQKPAPTMADMLAGRAARTGEKPPWETDAEERS